MKSVRTALLVTMIGLGAGCDWSEEWWAAVEPHLGAPVAPPDAGVADGPTIMALGLKSSLFTFRAGAPGVVSAPIAVSGLAEGEWLVGITVRPKDGGLFGVSNLSRLYRVDRTTGAADPVAPAFAPALAGGKFGVDFNPTVDRIRVVSDVRQNLRLHPDLGTVIDFDAATAGVQTDADLNPAATAVAAAYTNSVAGATTTTLYLIDAATDTLVRQGGPDGMPPSPNTGALTTIGALGVDTKSEVGFDIAPGSNVAYAALNVAGKAQLHTVDLSSGAAGPLGMIGDGAPVYAIAVLP